MDIREQSERATGLLQGKELTKVMFHRPNDLMLEFTDGTRLYVNSKLEPLELSIVGGEEEED